MMIFLLMGFCSPSLAGQDFPCLRDLSDRDAFLLADPRGKVLLEQNGDELRVPASTLKILTALVALHHLGPDHRFKTVFYLDKGGNLKVKGYGDPLLISEHFPDMARALGKKVSRFKDLILDDTFFAETIDIPGRGRSTRPHDAPVGALCSNFNTVAFRFDSRGRIVSSEPQTPMTPFAMEKIQASGQKQGRLTFVHGSRDGTLYTGDLLLHFFGAEGMQSDGGIRRGTVDPQDEEIFIWHSGFSLEEIVRRMLEFSSNFIANQILIATGAEVLGAPGTLDKGVEVLARFAGGELGLKGLQVAEGSGLSRNNRLSAREMLIILDAFLPYRHLLTSQNGVSYKTGTLFNVTARAGYMEGKCGSHYRFAFFCEREFKKVDALLQCLRAALVKDEDCP